MPVPPPFSPTVTLLTVVGVWQEAFAEALKPLGLTSRKYALLGHIRATPGISFSELARRSRITAPSAHVAVAAFKDDGLVEDATARAGAASQLQVTAAGEQLLVEAGVRLADLDARFAAAHPGLTEALRAHVTDLMTGRGTFS
jgi:DNA-binding MarR family transcriptional regulator